MTVSSRSVILGVETIGKHLWEYEHPHYSSDSNYFSKEVGKTFPSWKAFKSECGDQMEAFCSLVYRWDWEEGKNQDRLCLFCVNQRKGIYIPLRIMVEKADEPEVIEWLRPRVQDLVNLWSPFIEPLLPKEEWQSGIPYDPDPKDKIGECEFCGSEEVTVRSYENRRVPENIDKPKKWLCCLCAYTPASVAHDYGSQYEGLLQTICFAANGLMTEAGEEPDTKDISRFKRFIDRLSKHLMVDEVHGR